MIRTKTRIALLIIAAMAASGCGVFKKTGPKTPVLGQRVAVLMTENDAAVDPDTAALPMALPAPVANADWAQAGRQCLQVDGPSRARHQPWPGVQRFDRLWQHRRRAARLVAGGRRRPDLYDRHQRHRAGVRCADRRQGLGKPVRHREGQQLVALWRRRRLRQWPDLRDQRPRLRRRAGSAQRRRVVAGAPGRTVARRADGGRRHALRDEPGQPDLFIEDAGRLDQLVERGVARDRRRVRHRLARRSRRARWSPASRRAN